MHVPVTGGSISDSTHTITHWGIVGSRIETDDKLVGWGFTGTHAFLPGDRLIGECIKECYAPLLVGEDANQIKELIRKISHFPAMQWIGRAGISQLAISSIDTALWDLKAKKQGVPLWELLGGSTKEVLQAYNTDIGWLSVPLDELVNGVKKAIEQDGFKGIKIKVGSPDFRTDLKRLEVVRKAIGSTVMLAVDGNGRWDLETCLQFCREAEAYNIYWFEEPTWYDDVDGHSKLMKQSNIPVALGEQLYTKYAFETFINAGAIRFVQPDITRLAGISEFMEVSALARQHSLPIAPHVGDMGQVHVHLAFNDPACSILEYIPWIRAAFVEPIHVEDGSYKKPDIPGVGTTPTAEALRQYSKY